MAVFDLILEDNGIKYLKYTPNILRLYANTYLPEEEPPYFKRTVHKFRMIGELLFAHYFVVYLRKDEKIVGHLVVSRGGTRISMSDNDDIVIGPIWVVPNCRGGGYASRAIYHILHSMNLKYKYAYEYIDCDNIPSIRTVEKNDFEMVSTCSEYGLLKRIRENADGRLLVYRYRSQEGIK